MAKANEQISREKLVADIQAVMADTDRLLQSLAQGGEHQATELRTRMAQNLRAAKAKLEALETGFARRAEAATDRAELYVHMHPWQVVGIAAGVGVLAGLVLRGR